jgi:hypothetical protein
MARPRGRLWRIENGVIQNDAHPDIIQAPFRAVVDDVVKAYTGAISADIDSIYITGSVARGLASEGESDLNSFAVLAATSDPDLVLQDWVADAEDALGARHPAVTGVQLELWPYYSVFTDPSRFSVGAFIIRTHSACVWGVDLSTQLPDYRVSPAIANDDLVQIADDLADALDAIRDDPRAEVVRLWCRYAARCFLRSGFGLVQMQEGVHTRDADVCRDYLVRHFPARAGDFQQALLYAHQPTGTARDALRFLEAAADWIIPRAEEWLDVHNPNRDLDLLVDDVEELDDDGR